MSGDIAVKWTELEYVDKFTYRGNVLTRDGDVAMD